MKIVLDKIWRQADLRGWPGACHFPPAMYDAAMPARNPLKGISRIDQPEKHTHGFFVRLTRRGKSHSAFFTDQSHGGRQKALAAARQHYEKLLAKFGPAGISEQSEWMQEAKTVRPPELDLSQLIWVQCHGYRCLAYRNAKDRWVNFYTGKALADVVKPVY